MTPSMKSHCAVALAFLMIMALIVWAIYAPVKIFIASESASLAELTSMSIAAVVIAGMMTCTGLVSIHKYVAIQKQYFSGTI